MNYALQAPERYARNASKVEPRLELAQIRRPQHSQPVAPCERDGGVGDIGADRARVWPRARNGKRNRAAAGAEIEHPRLVSGGDPLQRELDQQFGLGPRDQDVGRDVELEAVELA